MNFLVRMFLRSLVAALLMSSTGRAETIAPVDPSGTWLTEDGRARIRLERCGTARDRVCGFIVWMKDPLDSHGQPLRDSFNPDPDQRTRALLGHQLILGLKLTPEGRFDGDIYNAEDGKSYAVSLWRDKSDRLKLKGCLLKLLCQTQTWTQTLDVQPGQLVGLTGDVGGPRADREWASLPPPVKAKSAAK
ncbi:uncharacterized protein (DUF2147 family) [Bradyrhizobium sp. USDA 4532]|uniref:DUF2147 domain-containing protein n=1 Tax=Bradyrhizobium TaxID=374 RepID=UPI000977D5F5|nr:MULTISPECIES: DUF2147 domain-containing protein [Bradyrhizobium]MCP1833609.1 uncharacterized protein (DUF2147 family) [Bradyrhizobium sp. USDA 4545]MCP1918353.1 uncharacterized protein (DUF2147 family) [Bradyrhizobium sp. USDA 4532]OMI03057.1 hypothetical protein BSN85_29080 [Bradyrhizobium brasilense]